MRSTAADKEAMDIPELVGPSGAGVNGVGAADDGSSPSGWMSALRGPEATVVPGVAGPAGMDLGGSERGYIGF
jgi:hypothetical protein